jgi:hypothetical protein
MYLRNLEEETGEGLVKKTRKGKREGKAGKETGGRKLGKKTGERKLQV